MIVYRRVTYPYQTRPDVFLYDTETDEETRIYDGNEDVRTPKSWELYRSIDSDMTEEDITEEEAFLIML